ncbi:MAG: flagellin [Sarcina sp.]
MRLHNNLMSLNVFKNYQNNLADNTTALSRISSGSKIMSAKDNPHKLGQSEHLRLQIKGLQAANKNVQDGVSMMQTADGGIEGISTALIRMRELTVQSGNGSLNQEDREIIQKEIESLKSTVNDLANNTEFNGVKLIGDKKVNDNRYPISHSMSSGANSGEKILIPRYDLSAHMLGDENGNTIANLDIRDGDINASLNTIDKSMKTVSDARNKFGAIANRFESLSNNQSSSELMLEGAEAKITGADIAKEMMEFSRTNILVEASNYMMAQTNELPNEVLRAIERI